MRIKRFKLNFLLLFLMAFCTVPILSQTSTTVVGTGNPAVDVDAVQNAVDTFDIVTLQGTFDFGFFPTGTNGVVISRPDLTIQGPATIIGGGRYIVLPELPAFWFLTPIFVVSPGVKVYNLELTDIYDTGILVSPVDSGNPVVVEGCGINSYWAGIITASSKCELDIRGNTISSYMLGICSFYHHSPANISDNDITIYQAYLTHVGIYVRTRDSIWLPVDPSNVPLTFVRDNFIDMQLSDWGVGIGIGDSGNSGTNCIVEGNVLTGTAGCGIAKYSYGGYNQFIGNDLSGLTATVNQLWAMARHDIYADNIFGPMGSLLPGLPQAGATVNVWSLNWHPPSTPMPEPTANNTFMDNDYRGTNMSGWEDGYGCIVLGLTDPVYPQNDVRDNFVFESGRFPEGTGGARMQILDLGIDNRVVGLPANYTTDPGVGQKMKEAFQVILESIIQSEWEMLQESKGEFKK